MGGGVTTPPTEPQMTSYIIETVRSKCIIAEVFQVRGQKYDKLSLKIVQNGHCSMQIFKNFPGEHAPQTPVKSFLALTLLKIYSSGKNTLKKVTKIDAPSLKKFSEYASDTKHFQKPYLRPFPRPEFKRLSIQLTFNLIQNYMYPTKTFWIRSCRLYNVWSNVTSFSTPPPLQNPGYGRVAMQ